MYRYIRKPECTKCGKEIEENRKGRFSYCRKCQTEMGRATRKKRSDLSPEQKRKADARTYARVYMERGKITKQPCVVCGCDESEMHHPDYNKPLFVVWLCRQCHTELHLLVIDEMGALFTEQLSQIAAR